eukprot:Rhum_TRINITY_DN18909_c0_g2::Rhum_TRINITY_DN18909_c0_g2_i1::g.168770::m.168770
MLLFPPFFSPACCLRGCCFLVLPVIIHLRCSKMSVLQLRRRLSERGEGVEGKCDAVRHGGHLVLVCEEAALVAGPRSEHHAHAPRPVPEDVRDLAERGALHLDVHDRPPRRPHLRQHRRKVGEPDVAEPSHLASLARVEPGRRRRVSDDHRTAARAPEALQRAGHVGVRRGEVGWHLSEGLAVHGACQLLHVLVLQQVAVGRLTQQPVVVVASGVVHPDAEVRHGERAHRHVGLRRPAGAAPDEVHLLRPRPLARLVVVLLQDVDLSQHNLHVVGAHARGHRGDRHALVRAGHGGDLAVRSLEANAACVEEAGDEADTARVTDKKNVVCDVGAACVDVVHKAVGGDRHLRVHRSVRHARVGHKKAGERGRERKGKVVCKGVAMKYRYCSFY